MNRKTSSRAIKNKTGRQIIKESMTAAAKNTDADFLTFLRKREATDEDDSGST